MNEDKPYEIYNFEEMVPVTGIANSMFSFEDNLKEEIRRGFTFKCWQYLMHRKSIIVFEVVTPAVIDLACCYKSIFLGLRVDSNPDLTFLPSDIQMMKKFCKLGSVYAVVHDAYDIEDVLSQIDWMTKEEPNGEIRSAKVKQGTPRPPKAQGTGEVNPRKKRNKK